MVHSKGGKVVKRGCTRNRLKTSAKIIWVKSQLFNLFIYFKFRIRKILVDNILKFINKRKAGIGVIKVVYVNAYKVGYSVGNKCTVFLFFGYGFISFCDIAGRI